jgi:gamma-glutamylcyclotransferase (GGCT)/AIG2-like uncharacterized protein YtfP
MTRYLFVYGTLKKEFNNPYARIVRKHARLVSTGRINAVLYRVSTYPAAVLSRDPTAWVEGEVYLIDDYDTLLRLLDEYEGYDAGNPAGSLFVRAAVPVDVDNAASQLCWVYLFNGPVANLTKVIKFVHS